LLSSYDLRHGVRFYNAVSSCHSFKFEVIIYLKVATNKFYELKELCNLLPISDVRTALKWCQQKKIAIEYVAGKKVVNRFLVDVEIDKTLLNYLKQNYPDRWEALYECYQNDDRIGYLLLTEQNKSVSSKTQRIKPKSDISARFLDQL